jgi:hypothetical protein
MDKKRFPLRRRWETEEPYITIQRKFLDAFDGVQFRNLDPLLDNAPKTEEGYADLRGFDFGMTGAFVGKAHIQPRYRGFSGAKIDFSESLFENCYFWDVTLGLVDK